MSIRKAPGGNLENGSWEAAITDAEAMLRRTRSPVEKERIDAAIKWFKLRLQAGAPFPGNEPYAKRLLSQKLAFASKC